MEKVKVKFYKTVNGKDRLIMTRYFDTMAEAMAKVEDWEEQTPDNYAVFTQN